MNDALLVEVVDGIEQLPTDIGYFRLVHCAWSLQFGSLDDVVVQLSVTTVL